MQRYRVLDSEKLFDQCVYATGGTRVQAIVGRSPDFDNADYLFAADNVIAEFKSLQKDFLTAPDVARKMHLMFNKWVGSGKVEAQYGHAIIRTDMLPLECARELIGLFKNPLEQPLKKANGQIAQTKEHLKRAEAVGLLILSNDGNYALDPEMTAHVLYHSLKEKYSSIEHVLVVSANVITHIPGIAADVFPFISITIPERRRVTDPFLAKLGTAWGEVLRKVTGRSLETLSGPFRRLQREEVQTMRFYPAEKDHVSR
jgi:hypothetical protein